MKRTLDIPINPKGKKEYIGIQRKTKGTEVKGWSKLRPHQQEAEGSIQGWYQMSCCQVNRWTSGKEEQMSRTKMTSALRVLAVWGLKLGDKEHSSAIEGEKITGWLLQNQETSGMWLHPEIYHLLANTCVANIHIFINSLFNKHISTGHGRIVHLRKSIRTEKKGKPFYEFQRSRSKYKYWDLNVDFSTERISVFYLSTELILMFQLLCYSTDLFFPQLFSIYPNKQRNSSRKSLGESKTVLNRPRRSPSLGIK